MSRSACGSTNALWRAPLSDDALLQVADIYFAHLPLFSRRNFLKRKIHISPFLCLSAKAHARASAQHELVREDDL